jgi:hypothetical protein
MPGNIPFIELARICKKFITFPREQLRPIHVAFSINHPSCGGLEVCVIVKAKGAHAYEVMLCEFLAARSFVIRSK